MRTTIDLADPLFRRVKAEASLRGLKMKEFVAQALESALIAGRPASKQNRKKLPLIKAIGKHVIQPTREELDAALWD